MKRSTDIVVCYSTDLEGRGLPDRVAGRSLARLRIGVGPVNAAFAVTRFLMEHDVAAVIACGVGGAYPRSGLAAGDVVCATTESYGDLGAESPEGFLELHRLGFPIVDGCDPALTRLPLDLLPTERRAAFVTCMTCTGTDERAAEIAERTGGAVESMEGAAIVHVARAMGVKVGEVRGISNTVGRRDRGAWRLEDAAAAARAAVVAWIESGAPGC